MYQFKTTDHKKNLILIAWIVALILIPVFYLAVTGKATVDENNAELRSRLDVALNQNELYLNDLKQCTDSMNQCSDQISSAQNALAGRDSQLAELRGQVSDINESLSSCQSEIAASNRTIQLLRNDLQSVVVNAARDVCCRPGINATSFGLSSGRIVCSGNYTIDCVTGQSDY
jgi:peptidoglycan hydrolase CwlO-like protein